MTLILFFTVLLALAGFAHAQGSAGHSSSGSSTGDQASSSGDDKGSTLGRRQHKPSAASKEKTPPGATAKCNDGSYSFDKDRDKACGEHGGVAQWF